MTEQWTPKVGDRVMVGEHGPYRVVFVESGLDPHSGAWADLRSIPESHRVVDHVPLHWLSPAPEPEPEEPRALGALVRFGETLAFLAQGVDQWRWRAIGSYGFMTWASAVTEWGEPEVIFADPAEVETLREQVDVIATQRDEYEAEKDGAWCQVETLRAEVEALTGLVATLRATKGEQPNGR